MWKLSRHGELPEAVIQRLAEPVKGMTPYGARRPNIRRMNWPKPQCWHAQCKFRALLPIKQHLSAQLTTSREIMLQQTATGRALQPHSTATPRTLILPTSLSASKSWKPIWQKAAVTETPTEKAPEAYQVRPALEPATPGAGGSFDQQWSLPIQNHPHQYHQWHHWWVGHCHHQPVLLLYMYVQYIQLHHKQHHHSHGNKYMHLRVLKRKYHDL